MPAFGAAPSAGRPPVPAPSVATGSGPGSTAVRTAYPYPVRPGFGDAPIGAGTGFVAGVSNQTAIGSPDRNRPTATRTRSRVRPLRVVVLVVLVVAFGVASVAHTWNAPEWLEPFGAWASIVILLLLGVFNLLAVRRTPPGAVVTFEGWRSTLYGRVLQASGAWPILGVGALFHAPKHRVNERGYSNLVADHDAGDGERDYIK